MTVRPHLFLFVAIGLGATLLVGCQPAKTGKARGAELFQACTSCHGPDGRGNAKIQAPQIAGLPAWYVERQLKNFKAGIRGAHPNDAPGMRMRPLAKSMRDEEMVKEVSAYVATLWPEYKERTFAAADPAHGKVLFQTCSACHGPDGAGQKALNAPPLNRNYDWYIYEQLRKFKAGIRGTDPKDTIGATMRPMAMGLPDDQAMRDVAAYIMTLQR